MEDEVGETFGGQRGPLRAQNSLWNVEWLWSKPLGRFSQSKNTQFLLNMNTFWTFSELTYYTHFLNEINLREKNSTQIVSLSVNGASGETTGLYVFQFSVILEV